MDCSYRDPDFVIKELSPDKALQKFLHKHHITARKVSIMPVTGSIIIHMFIESFAEAACTMPVMKNGFGVNHCRIKIHI